MNEKIMKDFSFLISLYLIIKITIRIASFTWRPPCLLVFTSHIQTQTELYPVYLFLQRKFHEPEPALFHSQIWNYALAKYGITFMASWNLSPQKWNTHVQRNQSSGNPFHNKMLLNILWKFSFNKNVKQF